MSKAVAKESCRTAFCAAASAFSLLRLCVRRQFRSALFCPAKGRFCPPYLWPQCCPAFPGMAARFAERSYYTREKSIGTPLRAFILLFPPVFTMFFIKKSLQMNFKNLLYDYKFNFFTQTFSFRFVWGSEVCAFRAASALR